MKVADLDFYFNLRSEIENNKNLPKYCIAGSYTVDLHRLFTTEWLYQTPWFYDDTSSYDVRELQYKVEKESRFKLHIYDTDMGKSKFMTLRELPLYLKTNKVVNLDGNEETLVIKGFQINTPKTFYNLKDILVYVNQNKSIFIWTKETCFKALVYSYNYDSKHFYHKGMYSDDVCTYGIKVHGGGIRFYYREPSKYIYSFGLHTYAREIADNMTREQFIDSAKFGKFDFFGD